MLAHHELQKLVDDWVSMDPVLAFSRISWYSTHIPRRTLLPAWKSKISGSNVSTRNWTSGSGKEIICCYRIRNSGIYSRRIEFGTAGTSTPSLFRKSSLIRYVGLRGKMEGGWNRMNGWLFFIRNWVNYWCILIDLIVIQTSQVCLCPLYVVRVIPVRLAGTCRIRFRNSWQGSRSGSCHWPWPQAQFCRVGTFDCKGFHLQGHQDLYA